MIIQIFLSGLLAGVAFLIALQRTTSRLVRAGIIAVTAIGAFFVWVPEQTTVIAEVVGVGRGADLLLYLWVVITLGLILVLYLKLMSMGRRVTQLARALALAQVLEPEGSKDRA